MRYILLIILIVPLVAALASPHATHAQDEATEADLEALGAKLKAAIDSSEMTEKEALAEYEEAAGKIKGAKTEKGKDDELVDALSSVLNIDRYITLHHLLGT